MRETPKAVSRKGRFTRIVVHLHRLRGSRHTHTHTCSSRSSSSSGSAPSAERGVGGLLKIGLSGGRGRGERQGGHPWLVKYRASARWRWEGKTSGRREKKSCRGGGGEGGGGKRGKPHWYLHSRADTQSAHAHAHAHARTPTASSLTRRRNLASPESPD